MTLRLRDQVLEPSPEEPLVMAIANASPESFSGAGGVADVEDALRQLEQGAHLIDVGGESSATDAPPVSAEEEASRVLPLVRALVAEGAIVSVDTWKPPVARAALEAGAAMVNDVSGLRDPALASLCAEYGAGLVIMHTGAAPKRKEFPGYADVRTDVRDFLRERMELALSRGVGEDRIVLDPGPDFGKTPAETVDLLGGLPMLAELGRPLLLALSRKDFVGALTGRTPAARLGGTLAAIGAGLDAGGSIVRVHDVPEVIDFLKVRAALRGRGTVPQRLPEELRREPVS